MACYRKNTGNNRFSFQTEFPIHNETNLRNMHHLQFITFICLYLVPEVTPVPGPNAQKTADNEANLPIRPFVAHREARGPR